MPGAIKIVRSMRHYRVQKGIEATFLNVHWTCVYPRQEIVVAQVGAL